MRLYRYIYRLQDRRHLYRKLYSYFRVTSAMLESFTSIVVIVILMFVNDNSDTVIKTSRIDSSINNYRSNTIIGLLEQRMATFFGVHTDSSNYNYVGIIMVKDVVLSCSMLYSLMIILTALVKYWHQAKNVSLSVAGQVILGIYLGLLIINKLTTAISLLRSCQILTLDGDMKVFLILIFMFILFCLRLGLVYIYKKNFSRNWSTGDQMDQWLNVIINTYVVIPFTHYQSPVLELKNKQSEFRCRRRSGDQARRRSDPLVRREEILHALRRTQAPDDDQKLPFLGHTHPSSEELKQSILKQWWSNPSRKLTIQSVQNKVYKREKPDEDMDHKLQQVLTNLESVGLINTPLLTPAPTRHEYFALFLLVIVENIVSVVIEAYIGKEVYHRETGESLHYISWDIRLYCLFFALVFLIAYYYK